MPERDDRGTDPDEGTPADPGERPLPQGPVEDPLFGALPTDEPADEPVDAADPDEKAEVEAESSALDGAEEEPDEATAAPSESQGSDTPESDTAESDATEAQPEGRPVAMERLRSMLLTTSRSQAVVGVLLAALGFAVVTQVRSTEEDNTYEGRREEELIQILNGLTGTADRTRREIARLEQTRRDLQTDTSARRAAVEQAEQRVETLNVLAGLVPVTGPGLRITVTEQVGPVPVDLLLDMVQELRTAGAEAMEFNGKVRLVASSAFSEKDGIIHLDGEPLRSPYVLKVIGEPPTLHAGLTFPSGPIATLRDIEGADVAIEELDAVDITSVRKLPEAEFAEPAEGQ